MKVLMWYVFVVLTCILLIISVFIKDIYLAIAAFVMAMLLDRYKKDIPIPKAFQNIRVVHMDEKNNEDKK
ncbi:hypothetical protein ACER0A_002020 [Haloimpatiens sp. FM7315]|uniref:hypothetical protein n=1 Tax=Haloimpatiens sp. FM7315 TaxID=3298609 RepID=UPI0035A3297C